MAVPTRRQALIALRNNGSPFQAGLAKLAAKAGNASTMDSSSLIALAASVAMNSSESWRDLATLGLAIRRKIKTEANLNDLFAEFCIATIASSFPILERAKTAAWRMYWSAS